jgi:hypothetical protein
MKTDFPTASVGSSQAPTAAVEKSQSASNTEIQTRPLGQLQRHGDGAAEAFVHRASPLLDAINLVLKAIELAWRAVGRLQADVVLGVSPIDADEGGEFTVAWRLHGEPPGVKTSEGRGGPAMPGFCEGNMESRCGGMP